MSVSSIELLRFILGLLGDPGKAKAFNDDPSGALSVAGLSDISCADVDAIAPLIANSVPGAVAIAKVGGAGGAEPTSMIKEIVHNVAVSTFDNSGVIQNIWGANEVRQAFASDGGLAIGGDLFAKDPVIVGDGNVVATDRAQAAGRDVIQNNGDGNLALGSEQTIAQDSGVIAGGDSMAGGDKVGGNNNEAENTGNDNSVTIGDISVDLSRDESTTVGGNQYNAENTGNTTLHDQSVTVGGNQNNAENTGNATYHDESTTIGDIAVDLSDRSDNSTTVGGNQNNAENTGNATYHDESITVGDVDLSDDNSTTIGDISVDLSDDHSIGGDNWEEGSNVGGIGNTDSRNSNNTVDSGNTVVLTKVDDNSLNVGTIAVDLSEDNSVKTGDIIDDDSVTVGDVDLSQDHSTTVGDVAVDLSDDNSVTTGDIVDDDSISVGDVDLSHESNTVSYVDDSVNVGDVDLSHQEANLTYTYDDHSVGGNVYETGGGSSYGGDYYEHGSGNTTVDTDVAVTTTTTEYDFEYDG